MDLGRYIFDAIIVKKYIFQAIVEKGDIFSKTTLTGQSLNSADG